MNVPDDDLRTYPRVVVVVVAMVDFVEQSLLTVHGGLRAEEWEN